MWAHKEGSQPEHKAIEHGEIRRTLSGAIADQELMFDCVKKTRERHAVGEMRDGPSESPCGRRLQTAMSCFGQKPRWRTSWLKGAALTASCMGERDERKRTSDEAS
jgi:hypothetical protein